MKPTSGSERKRVKPFPLIPVGGDKYKSFNEAWQEAKKSLAILIIEEMEREEREKQERRCTNDRRRLDT